jgi:hypothetical protein
MLDVLSENMAEGLGINSSGVRIIDGIRRTEISITICIPMDK